MHFWAWFCLVLGVLAVGAASCPQRFTADSAMGAVAAGDATALVEGCGHQLVPGYTYCRKQEGTDANDVLFFVGPKITDCNHEACVTFKIFRPNGNPALGGAIPKGETKVSIPWSLILGRDKFLVEDRGFWPFIYEIRWKDQDGHERVTISEGEIRLRVYRTPYVPLHDVSTDSNFVWEWVQDGASVKMTTGARTYVGRRESP